MDEQQETAEAPEAGTPDREGKTGGQQQTGGRTQDPPPSVPYEEPSALDGLKAWAGDLFGQASEVIMRPGEFFAALPAGGALGAATMFAVAMGAVAGVLGFVLRVFPLFSAVFTTPFAAFAGTVVGAVVIHALAVLAGGKAALEGSYRLAAYMAAFLPLIVVAQVLPYLHIAVAGYAVYALILGVVPVHGIEERRAWSIFGPAGAVVLLLSVMSTSAVDELRDMRSQQDRTIRRLERRLEKLR
jgi:hypothetical protein